LNSLFTTFFAVVTFLVDTGFGFTVGLFVTEALCPYCSRIWLVVRRTYFTSKRCSFIRSFTLVTFSYLLNFGGQFLFVDR
jgi:hypothetical protein